MRDCVLIIACVVTAPGAGHAESLDGLPRFLLELPEVTRVCVSGPADATTTIVHLRDRHFLTNATFVASVQSVQDEPVAADRLDTLYGEFLADVEHVQVEHAAVLRAFIRRQGVQRVYLEGLTPRDVPIFAMMVRAAGKVKAGDPLRLRVGAAGELLAAGELAGVSPLEDEAAFKAANPIDKAGNVAIDQEANERREDAQVRNLAKAGGVIVAVLGAAHDLADNVARLAPGCRVVAVTTRSLGEIVAF